MNPGKADEILTALELQLMPDSFVDTCDTDSTNSELCDTDAMLSLASNDALSCSTECSGGLRPHWCPHPLWADSPHTTHARGTHSTLPLGCRPWFFSSSHTAQVP